MKYSRTQYRNLLVFSALLILSGCEAKPTATTTAIPAAPSTWMGIPSAVNQVIVFLHESTGWLLNKSEVDIKKVSAVRESAEESLVADFSIAVQLGDETFETTAENVPCDRDGIPTDEAVERLRDAVERIKEKMTRLQL